MVGRENFEGLQLETKFYISYASLPIYPTTRITLFPLTLFPAARCGQTKT